MKGKDWLKLAIAVGVFGLAGYLVYSNRRLSPDDFGQTACTQEVKLCPGGSYVGRGGPDCEFAACPAAKSSSSEAAVKSKEPSAIKTVEQIGKKTEKQAAPQTQSKNYSSSISQAAFSSLAPNPEPVKNNSDRLVLHNIGIELEPYSAGNRAGDIVFTKSIGEHFYKKAFMEFGTELTGPGGTDIMPHPTYILPLGTKLFSPVKGVVENVRYQPEYNDYEIVIIPDGYSNWRLSFDHITNLKVTKGSRFEVKDIVAEVAPSSSSAVPAGFGLVELQVWGERSFFQPEMTATCPFLLLDESVRQSIYDKITRLANDWENYLGQDVYRQEKWVAPGCLYETAGA